MELNANYYSTLYFELEWSLLLHTFTKSAVLDYWQFTNLHSVLFLLSQKCHFISLFTETCWVPLKQVQGHTAHLPKSAVLDYFRSQTLHSASKILSDFSASSTQNCIGFTPRSQGFAFGTLCLSAQSVRYPDSFYSVRT